jgi:hypothetical protein
MGEQTGYVLVLVVVIAATTAAAVLSPATAPQTIGFGVLIATSILGLMGQARAAVQAQKAAVKVQEVADQTAVAAVKVQEVAAQTAVAAVKVEQVAEAARQQDTKIDSLAKVATATHTLVNSNYGASLKATLNALTAVEALTTDPKAKTAAQAAVTEAQRLYDDHVAKQATVDATPPI